MAQAQTGDQELANWFNDPFFQVRAAVSECPTPLGPLTTRDQARQQEHYRAERGTSCYLSGECKKPNAYSYDADIGAAVQAIFANHAQLAQHSGLWITVSRRFVYVEGCSSETDDLRELEGLIRSVPDVQTVLLNIGKDPNQHMPYTTLKKSTLME
jgi:hypothetical protein